MRPHDIFHIFPSSLDNLTDRTEHTVITYTVCDKVHACSLEPKVSMTSEQQYPSRIASINICSLEKHFIRPLYLTRRMVFNTYSKSS